MRLSSNADVFASNAIGTPKNATDGLAVTMPRYQSSGLSPPLVAPLNPFSDQLLDFASLYGVSDKMEYDARLHRSAAGMFASAKAQASFAFSFTITSQ